jgi:ATP-binding cassette, subfamily C (CFTR/MRP), member 1
LKYVKFKCLESVSNSSIVEYRNRFLGYLRSILFWLGISQGYTVCVPAFMHLLSFSVYALSAPTLDPRIIFPALSLLSALFVPLQETTMAIQSFSRLFASWARLESFMLPDDDNDYRTQKKKHTVVDGSIAIKVQIANTLTEFPLQANFEVVSNSLVAIVGTIGSGKSLLLKTILSRIDFIGSVLITGNMAYCPQQPWIMNGTVAENILFKKPMENERFSKILSITGLDIDMKSFRFGVDTQLGQNGSKLSGGQSSRLSLARALYSDADIYIFDDILSALDGRIASRIFFDCLKGYLKGKTILFVTHQLQFLGDVDQVIWLDKGMVKYSGTFESLQQSFIDLHSITHTQRNIELKNTDELMQHEDNVMNQQDYAVLEDRNTGRVPYAVYKAYIDAIGGWMYPVILFAFMLLSIGLQIWSYLFLSYATTVNVESFVLDFSLLGLSGSVSVSLFFGFALLVSYRGATYLHNSALFRILRVPISWFENQPIGRILNRFSSDITAVDVNLLSAFVTCSLSLINIIVSVVLVAQSDWYLTLLLILISFLLYKIFLHFQDANIELKRLVSISHSPVDSHISDTITGLETIQAYHLEHDFLTTFYNTMDTANQSFYIRHFLNVWIQLRVGLLISLVTFAVVLISILAKQKSEDQGSKVGLALTASIGLATQIFILLQSLGEGEAELNAVERLVHYTKLEHETFGNSKSNWLQVGKIEFEDVEFRYPSQPDVYALKKVSFSIEAGEKVGIVGRTGSGKSTLVSTLFRQIEISFGVIKIDDTDISTLDLYDLRSQLYIVPQKAVFFTGTIRINLDPHSKYSDQDIWEVLKTVKLKEVVEHQPEKLETGLKSNQTIFSAGQQQLFELAKAILVKPLVLILDEATASVDKETDKMIQELVKEKFKNSTILTIAHRLETVADYDKILVMDVGSVAEYDTPFNLLHRNSIYASMIKKIHDF